ncbi:MAG: hypothetical protein IJ783_08440 [Kiritimatiellae bacterium]|nr:hypothetical protein [Kiritimatiellia bacterium]
MRFLLQTTNVNWVTGDAIVIDDRRGDYKGFGTVSITGGIFTSEHAQPVGSCYASGEADGPIVGFISGRPVCRNANRGASERAAAVQSCKVETCQGRSGNE